ncbi:hypothetical protein BKA66DRAFT_447026 [Pyrenochaeta sp. MPI-SDFR-AT-0127]|nr:hypothetical protein BKA66DRAFT_447026 [Pyrenochaeta sp. MPI-SDFR-AT-0127]
MTTNPDIDGDGLCEQNIPNISALHATFHHLRLTDHFNTSRGYDCGAVESSPSPQFRPVDYGRKTLQTRTTNVLVHSTRSDAQVKVHRLSEKRASECGGFPTRHPPVLRRPITPESPLGRQRWSCPSLPSSVSLSLSSISSGDSKGGDDGEANHSIHRMEEDPRT